MRTLSLIIFYFFFIFISGMAGLLFDLHLGLWIGSGFAITLLLVFFKFGEKIILILAKARYVTDEESMVNQVKNFCTLVDIKDVKIYWSSVYYNNVYFINSYWGTPSIIVGKNVYQTLSKNELNSLLYATLLRVKSNESKHRANINLVTLALFWWLFWLRKLARTWRFSAEIGVILFPAFYLKSIWYKKSDDTAYFDNEVFKHEFLSRDYIAALFKVNKMEACLPISTGAFALSGLSHTYNTSVDALFYLLIQNEIPIEKRMKAISGNPR